MLPPETQHNWIEPALTGQLSTNTHHRRRFFLSHAERSLYSQTLYPYDPVLPFPFLLKIILEQGKIKSLKSRFGFLHANLEARLNQVPFSEGFNLVRQINPLFSEVYAILYLEAWNQLHNRSRSIFDEIYKTLILEMAHAAHHSKVISRMIEILVGSYLHEQALSFYTQWQAFYRAFSFYKESPVLSLHSRNFYLEKEELDEYHKKISLLKKDWMEFKKEVAKEKQIQKTLADGHVIHQETALNWGLTGIWLRSTGNLMDLRRDMPYLAYSSLFLEPSYGDTGDDRMRFALRIGQVDQSFEWVLRLLEQAKTQISAFIPVNFDPLDQPKAGIATAWIEALEGVIGCTLMSDGTHKPVKVHLKTPSFALAGALNALLAHTPLDRLVLSLHGLGLYGTEIDR